MRFYSWKDVVKRCRIMATAFTAVEALGGFYIVFGPSGEYDALVVCLWAAGGFLGCYAFIRYVAGLRSVKEAFLVRDGRVVSEYIADDLYVRRKDLRGIKIQKLDLTVKEVSRSTVLATGDKDVLLTMTVQAKPDIERLQAYYTLFLTREPSGGWQSIVTETINKLFEFAEVAVRQVHAGVQGGQAVSWPYAEDCICLALVRRGFVVVGFSCVAEEIENEK